MATLTELLQQHAISAEDWPGEQLNAPGSSNANPQSVSDQELSTGVCVESTFCPRNHCFTFLFAIAHEARKWTVGNQFSSSQYLAHDSDKTR